MKHFSKGERVAIINRTYVGRFIVEGFALIVRQIEPNEARYMVRFDNGDTVERFVDPMAQANPQAMCDSLNAPIADRLARDEES